MLGPHDPTLSIPGTIRGDFSSDKTRNAIHGADCPEAADNEINLWFNESELIPWKPSNAQSVFEV